MMKRIFSIALFIVAFSLAMAQEGQSPLEDSSLRLYKNLYPETQFNSLQSASLDQYNRDYILDIELKRSLASLFYFVLNLKNEVQIKLPPFWENLKQNRLVDIHLNSYSSNRHISGIFENSDGTKLCYINFELDPIYGNENPRINNDLENIELQCDSILEEASNIDFAKSFPAITQVKTQADRVKIPLVLYKENFFDYQLCSQEYLAKPPIYSPYFRQCTVDNWIRFRAIESLLNWSISLRDLENSEFILTMINIDHRFSTHTTIVFESIEKKCVLPFQYQQKDGPQYDVEISLLQDKIYCLKKQRPGMLKQHSPPFLQASED